MGDVKTYLHNLAKQEKKTFISSSNLNLPIHNEYIEKTFIYNPREDKYNSELDLKLIGHKITFNFNRQEKFTLDLWENYGIVIDFNEQNNNHKILLPDKEVIELNL